MTLAALLAFNIALLAALASPGPALLLALRTALVSLSVKYSLWPSVVMPLGWARAAI